MSSFEKRTCIIHEISRGKCNSLVMCHLRNRRGRKKRKRKKDKDGATKETSFVGDSLLAAQASVSRAEEKEDQSLEGEPEGYAFRFSP